jgi:hypothetical protein
VSISVSGQSEQWAQLNAYQPPAPEAGQNSASALTSALTGGAAVASTGGAQSAPGSPGNAISAPGSTSGALSDGICLALIAFGGGWNPGTGSSSQAVSQSGGTSGATPPGSVSLVPGGPNPQSQGLQSLLSALTGAGAAASIPAVSGTATTPAETGTRPSAVTDDLQSVAPDLGTTFVASGISHPGGTSDLPPDAPPSGNAIPNTGTNASDGRIGSKPSYSDGLQQQFALSAYSASITSALDNSAASSLAGITA